MQDLILSALPLKLLLWNAVPRISSLGCKRLSSKLMIPRHGHWHAEATLQMCYTHHRTVGCSQSLNLPRQTHVYGTAHTRPMPARKSSPMLWCLAILITAMSYLQDGPVSTFRSSKECRTRHHDFCAECQGVNT